MGAYMRCACCSAVGLLRSQQLYRPGARALLGWLQSWWGAQTLYDGRCCRMSPEATELDWGLPAYQEGLKVLGEEDVFLHHVRGVCGLLANAGVAPHGPQDSMERLR